MNRKARAMRIFLVILFCMIAERAIAQANFEQGPLKDWVGECAGVIANLISNGPSIEGSGRFCPPVVPPRQALMAGLLVLGLYLQRHPEQLHLQSHLECKIVALPALQEAWPCPK